jgi:hypothetical protein
MNDGPWGSFDELKEWNTHSGRLATLTSLIAALLVFGDFRGLIDSNVDELVPNNGIGSRVAAGIALAAASVAITSLVCCYYRDNRRDGWKPLLEICKKRSDRRAVVDCDRGCGGGDLPEVVTCRV